MNKPFIQVAKEAAKIGGDILVQALGNLASDQISLKGLGDYVTELDHRSEQAIVEYIQHHYPDHSICAEERGLNDVTSEYQWVIDPLDGTTNYVHGIPFFSVSVAILKDGQPIAGVVLDPVRDECFWAEKGKGAFLDTEQITIGTRKELNGSLLGTGFPWRSKPHMQAYMKSFEEFFHKAAGVRRMGTAAIDLSYTACGRFDGFWEMNLKPWDIGAGILIVQEAGGVISDFNGGDTFLKTGNVVAANASLHREMIEVTRDCLGNV